MDSDKRSTQVERLEVVDMLKRWAAFTPRMRAFS
jgi:hypothetical protein